MNRSKVMISGVLTAAMFTAGIGTAAEAIDEEVVKGENEPPSAECLAFARDPDADPMKYL